MYPEVPYEVGLSHLESHPEKLDKEKSTIEYDILAAALRYFPTPLLKVFYYVRTKKLSKQTLSFLFYAFYLISQMADAFFD